MRLVVVGTGLMGGSFALAARARNLFEEILGVEPDPARGRRAVARGVVDGLVDTVPDDADAVLLAGPSHTVAGWVVRLADHPGVLFDLASVKEAVLDEVRALQGTLPGRFVPCHPITGSEKSGPDAADAALFQGSEVILTPGPETDPDSLARVAGWWQAVGARTLSMEPRCHDDILAVTSHLPHLLAFAYLQRVGDRHLAHAAGGFRDFTRIGAADADLWAPVFDLNRRALLTALDDLETDLAQLRGYIESGDQLGLKALIRAAAERRRRFSDDS